ncbi:MAG TPA: hypothetical protein VGF76_01195, partial [Polyangiaceae bacterium]
AALTSAAGGSSGAGDSGNGGQPESAAGSAGSADDGGAGGMSQAAGSNGAAGGAGAAGQKGCVSVTECPRPANECLTARCSAGACLTENVPAGSLFVLDAPADCHATTACDGLGHATLAIDQDNAPTSNNPCLVGTCNNSGAVGTEPLRRGASCGLGVGGGGKCDGKGSCVTCLVTADCPLGQSCTVHQTCGGKPCTELNCGGACPACLGKQCSLGSDCTSHACDPVTLLCSAAQQCTDAQQDGNETDTDCGGGTCPGCAVGHACLLDTDCGSWACDAGSLLCVATTCLDHHRDSDESDVDCGGTSCDLCGVGKNCNSNFDCISGHFCAQGSSCL